MALISLRSCDEHHISGFNGWCWWLQIAGAMLQLCHSVTIAAQHLIQLLLFLLSKQEYSWEDHGFPLVSRFFNEAASVLDEKFNVAFSFTYRK